MGDYSADWEADRARLLAAHIARTVGRLETLAGRYVELRAMLAADSAGRPDTEGGSRPAAGPRLPVRVDVLDTLADIDRFLADWLPLVRGTLRLGSGAGNWTVRTGDGGAARVRSGLLFLAGSLGAVYSESPGLGDDVSAGAWRLERRAGWIFGERSRPFALVEPCAACGVPSLWVVPERMAIVCGNPACGASRPVHAALPAYSAGSDSIGTTG
jgi:hypothetical protein